MARLKRRLDHTSLRALIASMRPRGNRFLAKKTTVQGVTYDSATEAKRGYELGIRERAGEIADLKRQVPFELRVNGEVICTYVADFTYVVVASGEEVVEDVKSPRTRKLHDYRIKVKLMHAVYGVNVMEQVNGAAKRAVRLPKDKAKG